MALTRNFKDTVRARVQADPAFRSALLTEAVNAFLLGDIDTGKAVLRDYIKATVGFEELAEQTGSSKGYIWELENRDTRKPSAEKLMKIAEVLGVTSDFLLDDSKSEPDDSVMKAALYRNFERLDKNDQQRFMKIIVDWGNKNESSD